MPMAMIVTSDGVGYGFDRKAAKAHIGRSIIVEERLDGGGHFVAVAGAEHRHAGDDPHKGEVLDALVGGAVLADREAAVGADHLDVEVGVCDRVAHLLIGAAGGKHRERVGKRFFAAGREARRNAHHVRLGDADIKKLLRIRFCKAVGHRRARKVGVEHDQVGIAPAECHKRLAVCGAGCNYLSHD